MKKSNVFMALGSVFFIILFAYNGLQGKKITAEEYWANRKHSLDSLTIDTYNYNTVIFDKPFNRIVIKDTTKRSGWSAAEKQIRWVRSSQSGLKKPRFERYIRSYKIENKVLVITLNPNYSSGLNSPIVFYGPTLEQISIKNNWGLRLINSRLDTLRIAAELGSLVIDPTNRIEHLETQAFNRSKVTVDIPHLIRGDYMLQDNSEILNRTQQCNTLELQGDVSSKVQLAMPVDSSRSQYGTLKYDDQIGQVILETSEVDKIQGNPDKLKMVMGISGFERIMRVALN